jgi:hypothetical protein
MSFFCLRRYSRKSSGILPCGRISFIESKMLDRPEDRSLQLPNQLRTINTDARAQLLQRIILQGLQANERRICTHIHI